ncbi:hypothetical protein PT2222_190073 [Paraburkholderia tropica]
MRDRAVQMQHLGALLQQRLIALVELLRFLAREQPGHAFHRAHAVLGLGVLGVERFVHVGDHRGERRQPAIARPVDQRLQEGRGRGRAELAFVLGALVVEDGLVQREQGLADLVEKLNRAGFVHRGGSFESGRHGAQAPSQS